MTINREHQLYRIICAFQNFAGAPLLCTDVAAGALTDDEVIQMREILGKMAHSLEASGVVSNPDDRHLALQRLGKAILKDLGV